MVACACRFSRKQAHPVHSAQQAARLVEDLTGACVGLPTTGSEILKLNLASATQQAWFIEAKSFCLAEGTVGAEIEELVNTAGAGVQPGAGFFAFVQTLELPGGEGAEVIEVKPEAVERN